MISFRCYYPNGTWTNHYEDVRLKDIKKWIEAYKFTHPKCTGITISIKFEEGTNNVQL